MLNKQPSVILLIGPPGSGKSTWRESFMRSAPEDTVVISSDDLIEVWGKLRGLNYTEAFAQVDRKEIEATVKAAFREAVAAGKPVLVDRTNLSRKSRATWLSSLPGTYHRVAVVFNVPEEELRRRLAARAEATGKYIPDTVVTNMIASYEPPGEDEFDMVLTA